MDVLLWQTHRRDSSLQASGVQPWRRAIVGLRQPHQALRLTRSLFKCCKATTILPIVSSRRAMQSAADVQCSQRLQPLLLTHPVLVLLLRAHHHLGAQPRGVAQAGGHARRKALQRQRDLGRGADGWGRMGKVGRRGSARGGPHKSQPNCARADRCRLTREQASKETPSSLAGTHTLHTASPPTRCSSHHGAAAPEHVAAGGVRVAQRGVQEQVGHAAAGGVEEMCGFRFT